MPAPTPKWKIDILKTLSDFWRANKLALSAQELANESGISLGVVYRFIKQYKLFLYVPLESYYTVNENGCWISSLAKDEYGYSFIRINRNKKIGTHVFFWQRKFGKVPKGMELDHFFCNNSSCVNPDHRQPTTHKENSRASSHAKLNVFIVDAIKSDATKYTTNFQAAKALHRKYKVSKSTIMRVLNGETWM